MNGIEDGDDGVDGSSNDNIDGVDGDDGGGPLGSDEGVTDEVDSIDDGVRLDGVAVGDTTFGVGTGDNEIRADSDGDDIPTETRELD